MQRVVHRVCICMVVLLMALRNESCDLMSVAGAVNSRLTRRVLGAVAHVQCMLLCQ